MGFIDVTEDSRYRKCLYGKSLVGENSRYHIEKEIPATEVFVIIKRVRNRGFDTLARCTNSSVAAWATVG